MADKLPDHLAATVTKRMRTAYHAESALVAQAQLEALAHELDRTHPGAAASLREGMGQQLQIQLQTFADAVDRLFIIVAILTAAGMILAMFLPSRTTPAARAGPKTEEVQVG